MADNAFGDHSFEVSSADALQPHMLAAILTAKDPARGPDGVSGQQAVAHEQRVVAQRCDAPPTYFHLTERAASIVAA
jgi:hypothetical protein